MSNDQALCNICFADYVCPYSLADIELQAHSERLTNISLNSDNEPLRTCITCYTQLQANPQQLAQRELQVEEGFLPILTGDIQLGTPDNRTQELASSLPDTENLNTLSTFCGPINTELPMVCMQDGVQQEPTYYTETFLEVPPDSVQNDSEAVYMGTGQHLQYTQSSSGTNGPDEGLSTAAETYGGNYTDISNNIVLQTDYDHQNGRWEAGIEGDVNQGHNMDNHDMRFDDVDVGDVDFDDTDDFNDIDVRDTDYHDDIDVEACAGNAKAMHLQDIPTLYQHENEDAIESPEIEQTDDPEAKTKLDEIYRMLLKTDRDARTIHNQLITEKELSIKRERERKRRKFICDQCGDIYKSEPIFLKHMRKHKPRDEFDVYLNSAKEYACTLCDYKNVRRKFFRFHLRTHTGEKPFECPLCDYKATRHGNYRQHMKSHTGEKQHSCHICYYKTTRRFLLKEHMRTHTGEKPHACHLCDFTCTRPGNLAQHMKSHLEKTKKKFSCNLCDYTGTRHFLYKEHMTMHAGGKEFSCPTCDFECTRQFVLREHMRIHTGEKPYACHLCDYKGLRHRNLTQHLKTHTNKKRKARG